MNTHEKNIIQQYEAVFKIVGSNDWFDLMNHGYYPSSSLLKKDYVLKNSASLYLNLIEGLNTSNCSLLDIGCGRGGGVRTYKENFSLLSIDACDINPASVDFCISKHTGINFKVCNAETLNYADSSFDIITNVESSHCYTNLNKFVGEVCRLLKPSGVFCITDTFNNETLARTTVALYNNIKFKKIEKEDITKNVILSCYNFIEESASSIPPPLRNLLIDICNEKIFLYEQNKHFYKKFICFT